MNLDNLSKLEEGRVFRKYQRLTQSLAHTNIIINRSNCSWSVMYHCDVAKRIKRVPPPYTPIQANDLCLEDYLKARKHGFIGEFD